MFPSDTPLGKQRHIMKEIQKHLAFIKNNAWFAIQAVVGQLLSSTNNEMTMAATAMTAHPEQWAEPMYTHKMSFILRETSQLIHYLSFP